MTYKRIAVIFSAGPGTGAGLARALAPTHNLVLLSRSLPASLPSLALGHVADKALLAATYDGTGRSLRGAVDAARAKWPDARLDVGICNIGGHWAPGHFLDKSVDDLRLSLDAVASCFDFAQAVLPALLDAVPPPAPAPSPAPAPPNPTLFFTGATMSLRGGAAFSTIAPGMFARRALAQSLAREFGPRGVHIAHVVVDGVIDTERVRGLAGVGEGDDGGRLRTEDIAHTYLALIDQPRSAWTHELDLRPSVEKF
ncbi:hypothetical protein Q5752_004974 [Cryptotrichosporon argae]